MPEEKSAFLSSPFSTATLVCWYHLELAKIKGGGNIISTFHVSFIHLLP